MALPEKKRRKKICCYGKLKHRKIAVVSSHRARLAFWASPAPTDRHSPQKRKKKPSVWTNITPLPVFGVLPPIGCRNKTVLPLPLPPKKDAAVLNWGRRHCRVCPAEHISAAQHILGRSIRKIWRPLLMVWGEQWHAQLADKVGRAGPRNKKK